MLIPAYFLVPAAIFQIFAYSFFGTIVDISVGIVYCSHVFNNQNRILQNDKIYGAAKCFEWNRLSRHETHIYQIFLVHVQQPQIIYLADVWELNMDTCVSVRNSLNAI